MRRHTFERLIEEVKGLACMKKKNTRFRRAIPVEKRVAIAIWRLANEGSSFNQCKHMFGVGRQTAFNCFWDFAEACVSHLKPLYIWCPTDAAGLSENVQQFQRRSGYPFAFGAMDGCHFRIPEALLHNFSYKNRKLYSSINAMAVCDATTRILAVDIRHAGRSCDAGVYKKSGVKQDLEVTLQLSLIHI